MERNLICIGCPLGCQLTAVMENGVVTAVTGNTCPRGDEYARKECTAPERTVTGTVRVAGGAVPVVSVRTSRPIPKEKVLELAQLMARIRVQAPVRPGDVVAANVLETGSDLLATCSAAID